MANNGNPMESKEKKKEGEAKSSILDFEPYCAWQRGEECDTLAVHLHGFKKEQIKVQVNNHRIMIIHGQRPIDGHSDDDNEINDTCITRFTKHIKLPENCDQNRISAKFSFGVLSITMPKKQELPNNNINKNCTNCEAEAKRASNCCKEDSLRVKGLLTVAGKVAVAVLVVAISGAYVHASLYKKQRSVK